MKRIAIFSFYDKEGIVDSYIEFLLQELVSVVDRLIIVVNGYVDENGHQLFANYSKEIIVRENLGFDAGAYADILVNYLGKDEFKKWDELVLCNDTFYGPFVPLKDIFEKMSLEQKDFWGLNVVEKGLLSHIQSYFLVFNKRILQGNIFFDYIFKNIDMKESSIKSVCATFEVGLFTELKKAEYTYGSYTNTELYCIYRNPYRCIDEYNLPIMKKKSMSHINDLENQLKCLKRILEKTNYNIRLIAENASRLYGFDYDLKDLCDFSCDKEEIAYTITKSKYTEEEIRNWIKKDEFYIYGSGIRARELYKSCFRNDKNFMGFVVSNNQNVIEQKLFGYPIVQVKDAEMNRKFLVGMDKEYSLELKKEFGENDNFFFIWDK